MRSAATSIKASRSGFTSPYGKLDNWIERTRVESSVKEGFKAAAASVGKPEAEALRDLVRVVALGPVMAARMYGEGVLKVVRLIGTKTDTGK